MRPDRSLVLFAAGLAVLGSSCRRRKLPAQRPAATRAQVSADAAVHGPEARVEPPVQRLAPDTITVRLGSPGTQASLPLDTLIDPARLRLVVDSPYQSWSDEGTFVHVVAFTPDGRPCPRADVFSGDEQVGRTDAHGAFAFRRTPNREQDPQHVEHSARTRGRLIVLCTRAERTYLGVAGIRAFARTSSFERPVMYVYTDRGVYNPGQMLHARAIAWRLRGEYEPVPGQSVTLSLRREHGDSLGGGAIHTDAYGTGALDLALPAHLAEGRYTLVATVGEEQAEAQIRVQRFVPPVTRIEHTLGEFLTPAVRDLPFELNLHTFDGATFTRGHVVVTARVAETDIPIATRDVTGSGPHAFTVPPAVLARVRSALTDGERFDVKIDVTDATGRSDTLSRSLRIARNPYTVTIELDRQGYAPGERVDATVRIVDLNHVVVRGKHVELRGLGAPLAGDTGDDGVVHFRFPMPAHQTDVTAWVADVGEAIARTTLSVTSVHPMQSTVAQTTLREREPVDVTVRFPAGVVPVEDVVHADVVDSSGAIIESLLIPVDRSGSAPLGHLRFDAPSWGSMLLTLFATAAPREHASDPHAMGLVTDGQNIPVTPGATIDVTLDPLPAEARPGDRVHVSARVTRDGAPIDARIGAAVVDQAVISLLDPLEHDPRDRFYNPQQKVLAATGSQTLTWPVVQRTWGSDRYDIGWPSSFGFHGGDPGADETWSTPGEGAARVPVLLRTLLTPSTRNSGSAGGIVSPFGGLTESGMDGQVGNAIGDAFGYGGLGATGTGWGGGGTGEGTIGLGNIGTMGHGSAAERASSSALQGLLAAQAAVNPAPHLVVRTNFSETAAWLPSLDAHDGRVAFDVVLPDSITRQQVSLIATDRHGGLAVARAEIPVRQAFYVRSDLPPVLVENDRVAVSLVARVLGDAPTHAALSLTSDDLRVESPAATGVDVAAQGSAGMQFTVTALHPGRATYHFTGTGAGLEDRGERTLFVQPAGAPERTTDDGTLAASGSYALTFDDSGARYAVHTLSIALPTAVALADVLAATDAILGGDVESLACELDVATSLLGIDTLSRALGSGIALRQRAARSLLALLASQNADGGFGWWWDGRSEPGITAFALDVLERASHANLPVPAPAIERAAQNLIESLSRGQLLSARAMARWEGSGTRVRSVLTAQAAAALAHLPEAQRDEAVQRALATVRPVLMQLAASAASSPLEIAYAVYALQAIDATDRAAAHVADAAAVSRLLAARRERHWEPGWSDAFGGGIETTAVALEVLRAADPSHADAIEHDAVEYLLSTRAAWGAWHNVRGTAWALRALTRLPLGTEREGAHVHAEVDGRVVADVTVDPRDPWASTLSLRDIEITDLARGPHHLIVRYDGALAPRVHVTHARWGVPAATGRRATDPSLELLVSSAARTDAPVQIGFRASHVPPTRVLRVSVPIPPYGDPDAASLRALVASGALAGFEIGPRAVECLVVDPLPETTIRFGVRVPRAGHFTLTGASARIDGVDLVEAPPASLDVL